MGQRHTDLRGIVGWGRLVFPMLLTHQQGEEREADPKLWDQQGAVSGELGSSGRSSGGRAGGLGPCLLSPPLPFLQVSPSDSTLKREFSLDLVAMATLLTKSSFGGGGWLTQKLRGLGEGVPVLMGLLAERISPPPRLPEQHGPPPRTFSACGALWASATQTLPM